jgi:hypothetical protein
MLWFLLFLMVTKLASGERAVSCLEVNVALPLSNVTIDTSCAAIDFSNVTSRGRMTINISITAMLLANPAVPSLNISLEGLVLEQGSMLVIDSRGYLPRSGGASPNVDIVIRSLIGSNGALVFTGAFPAGTSILVTGANMIADSFQNVLTPVTTEFDPFAANFAELLLLANVTLSDNSTLIVMSSELQLTASTGFSIALAGELNLLRGSAVSISNCTLKSFWISLFFSRVRVLVTNSSSLSIHSSIFTSPLYMLGSVIQITQNSTLSVTALSASRSSDIPLKILNTRVLVDAKSVWVFHSNNATTLGVTTLDFTTTVIVIRDRSQLVFKGNRFLSEGFSALKAALRISNTSISLEHYSVWLMIENELLSQKFPPFLQDATSTFTVCSTCWTLWSKNNMSSAANETCLELAGSLRIQAGVQRQMGVMSFIDNNCSSSRQFFRNGTSPVIVLSGGLFYDRCNRLNGAEATSASGLPSTAVSAGACAGGASCNPQAECFALLTDVGANCSAAAGCPCRKGGAGNLCLPSGDDYTITNTLATPTILASATVTRIQERPHSSTHATSNSFSTGTQTLFVTDEATFSSSDSMTSETRVKRTLSLSASLSVSCPKKQTSSENATLILVARDGGAPGRASYPLGSSVPVSRVATSSTIIVRIDARPGVDFSAVGNASSSARINWATAEISGDKSFIVVQGDMSWRSAGALPLEKDSVLVVQVNVWATGRCLPNGFRERLEVVWSLTPLPPPTPIALATTVTFRSATVATSITGNPIGAMTMTAMVSIISLESCVFSDVDPLDASMSPIAVAVGPELGQYYRGGVVLVLGVFGCGIVLAHGIAVALRHISSEAKASQSHTARLALLRFPSVGMIAVGLWIEGLASCGVSLIRLREDPMDMPLGFLSLAVCLLIAAWALLITTGNRLEARTEPVDEPKEAVPLPQCLVRVADLSKWTLHYVDTSGTEFKRRHMMLIDGLLHPWWTAVELSSAIFQGAILGIRVSSINVCRLQQWILLGQSGVMVAATVYTLPFGAPLSNVFLVLSKLFAFGVSVIVLIATLKTDDGLVASAEIVTAVGTAVGSLEVALAVILVFFSVLPQMRQFVRRTLAAPGAAATNGENLDSLALKADSATFLRRMVLESPREPLFNATLPPSRFDSDLPMAAEGPVANQLLMDVQRWSTGGLEYGHSLWHLCEALRSEMDPIERLQHLVKAAVHNRRSARASSAAGAVPHGDSKRRAVMPPGLWTDGHRQTE